MVFQIKNYFFEFEFDFEFYFHKLNTYKAENMHTEDEHILHSFVCRPYRTIGGVSQLAIVRRAIIRCMQLGNLKVLEYRTRRQSIKGRYYIDRA
jgi:hypothetical protein